METEQNKTSREVSRWLRVGVLALTTLGPIISTVVSRLRERTQTLQELKEHPYSQQLRQRGGALVERGSKLSQDLVQRGSKVTQEASKRGRAATQDLAARGGQVAESLRGQPVAFWLTFGFGLLATAAATYLLVRNRLQR